MTDKLPTCKTCKFWGYARKTDRVYNGICRRYPPVPHTLDGTWDQPTTDEYTSCGEHVDNDEVEKYKRNPTNGY